MMLEASDCQPRILIVDDDSSIRGLLREYLSQSYRCAEASSAEEALELVRAEKFQLVLSDIQMGGLSGLEMVPRLLDHAPETIVIMVSGMLTIESAIEAMRAGAFDYITKPFNFMHVGAAIGRALEHQALREANRQSEERFRQIVTHATDIIYRTDVGGCFTLINPIAAQLMKRPAEELLGTHYLELVRPDYRRGVEKFYTSQFARKVMNTYYEFPAVTGDGDEIWLGQNVQLLFDGGSVTGFQAIVRDITRQHNYDEATGLVNRVCFEWKLGQALSAEGQDTQMRSVLLLSPDRFKRFIDSFGHAARERLLRKIAERLAPCVSEGNLLARFGDDEFSILLTEAACAEDVIQVAGRVHEALRQPFNFDSHELYVTASVGIAQSPDDGHDPQVLMKNAGAALFRAKELGGSNYQFYAPEMNARALKRLELESNLRRALEREEFLLHYQPQVDISSGRITGTEALLRWQHPEKGLISPVEFIPLAEETGLIIPIGEWALRAACLQQKAWRLAGFDHLQIAVNLSPRQFRQSDLVEMVARILKESDLDPRSLELELTESSVMENTDSAIRTLSALKEIGIQLSIDDFGTGYSSLSYLKRLPLDILKIDQSFVRDSTLDADDAAIVMAIITLAHSLRLKVIAEGVETEEQLEFLRLLKCDEAQGYLLSKPLPKEAVEQLLSKGQPLI